MTSIVLFVVGWLAGWWLLWRVPVLGAGAGRADAPPTAGGRRSAADYVVVVPARDEEANLPRLLASLDEQTLRPSEVVVVDDDSSDGTASVAEAHGARVIRSAALPPGWCGKSWACQQGADASRAPRLVFLDADVWARPHGLASALDEHDRAGGLLSVAPRHRMGSVLERLSAPFNLVAFMGTGSARPRRAGASDGAFGPCMVCHRADYERVGGHAAVGAAVTEDLALARAFERTGLPTWVFAGRGSFEYRMYPGGLRALLEGWSKNLASGARFVSAPRSLLIGLWVTSLLVAVQLAGLAVARGTGPSALLAAAAVVAVVVQQRVFLRGLTDAGWLTALAFPVTTAFFVVVFVRSVWWTVVRRRVRWRGRTLALTSPTPVLDLRPDS